MTKENEDCISREAVIRLVEQYPSIIGNRCSGLISDIKHLPPVTPSYNSIKTELKSCEDCISRQAVLDYAKDTCVDLDKYEDTEVFCDEIKAMSPVIPQRPKGKWILNSDYPDRLICEKCKAQFDMWHWESKQMHYCPNCGAEMSGGGEE